jgi:hypothetical protein
MEISLAFIFAAVFLSGVFEMMWGIHNQSGIAVILGSLLTLIGGWSCVLLSGLCGSQHRSHCLGRIRFAPPVHIMSVCDLLIRVKRPCFASSSS